MQDILDITIKEEVSRCLLCYDAPCSKACPAANRPDKFIRALYFQNKRGAAKLMLDANLLSGICAQSCAEHAYCQGACIRKKIDKPVNIPLIQQYLSQLVEQMEYLPEKNETVGKNVIIFGGNTAGLAAAVYLQQQGIAVTIYHFKTPQIEQNINLASLRRADSKYMQQAYNLVNKFGIEFKQITMNEIDNIANDDIDACIIASKEYSKWLQKNDKNMASFVTGELLTGPDNDAFAVKKGRQTAQAVCKYLLGREEVV
ncbi:hypothetical protein [Pectinatus brassicae]|uniref:dihydrouracil dehydrogenase (NAD(+)) n=1 Tax=Pectinatus brassicae TaxID=862415 RepID=A0A840UL69_9FIRM|nr:hypothetical protein [Pectinatus brassicae]MBB5336910.1 dihydropyrimidine dehydrogenase (NAD+) subunit PreT [Pectinatus brassicae]